MMNCDSFRELTSARCNTFVSPAGVEFVYAPLPGAFADGEPLPMYVVESAGIVCFSDFGEVISHFQRVGFRIFGDRRRRRPLVEAVKPYGCVVTDRGHIELWAHQMSPALAFQRFSAAMLAVAAWEADHSKMPIDGALLVEEVKLYLESTRPGIDLKQNVTVLGVSGHEYQFPLAAGPWLIDVATSHHASISSLVRKLVDVRAVPANIDRQIDVYVEDREVPRAQEDERLLNVLATPHLMSRVRAEELARAQQH